MADTKEIKPFVQLSVQGATKTTELTDFPDDLTGQGGKVPRVKEDGTGFELALPAESHDMASPVGATYLVSDFRKLVAGEGYRLPLNSGTDYVNLTSVGLTNRPDAKSAFIEKISEHLYQLVINENTSNGEFHDIYYLTLGDVLDDSLGLGNTGTTFNKDKTVFDLTTKLNNLEDRVQHSVGKTLDISAVGAKTELGIDLSKYNYIDIYFTTNSTQVETTLLYTVDTKYIRPIRTTKFGSDLRIRYLDNHLELIYKDSVTAPYVLSVVGRNI